MRHPASKEFEIIQLLSTRTYQLGIARTTFYRCYDRYLEEGFDGLEDRTTSYSNAWNRILM